MRGSTPLDVAASSVMDNNGLALALEEPDLEKVGHLHTPSGAQHGREHIAHCTETTEGLHDSND